MRIKKISPTTPANGNIENQYGTSQTNAYSEEYANTTFATKDVATTSANGLMSSTDKTKLTNNLNYPNATEVNTGITWFGSKPLYRKIVTGTISQSGSGTYPTINAYLDNPDFVMFRAFIYYTNGRYYADSYKIKPYYDKTNNVMVFNQPEVTGSVVIIFEYTKTTD